MCRRTSWILRRKIWLADAVVDGFGAWEEDKLDGHVKTSQHLCDILAGTDTRLLIVGGAGSLFVNPEHTAVVSDGADFPAMFLPLAKAQGEELTLNSKGESIISYADYAIAMVDEIEKGDHTQQRISVVRE